MNISSIVRNCNTLNFGTTTKSKKPEKPVFMVTPGGLSRDVFTSSKLADTTPKMEKQYVITYDSVYIFEKPVEPKTKKRFWN